EAASPRHSKPIRSVVATSHFVVPRSRRSRLPTFRRTTASTCSRAEDWIRTRDPHLGKVLVFIPLGPSSHLKYCSVHPVSSPSSLLAPVVERSTINPGRGSAQTIGGQLG